MGVPVFKYKVWAFAIGACIGGLSGALSAGQTGFINNQNFGVQTSILFLAAVVLGGAGSEEDERGENEEDRSHGRRL